ncbi:MAG: hypothetical protein NTX33_18770 [Propionibacteriales bacterium]|nr:hypothetical protein [Propionibacteriales bacterium]
MGARFAVAVVLVLALAGCGDDGKSSSDDPTSAAPDVTTSATSEPTRTLPSKKPTPKIPANAPKCADIWTADATLPGGYKGCVANRKYVRADGLGCSSGQAIVKYDDRFWAVRGGTISQAEDIYKSDVYLDSVARCRG